jgi:hypothetical protein
LQCLCSGLHGQWHVDSPISSSDRRLKKDIRPIDDDFARGDLDWVLRELRPVSYQFINGSESKYTRFGFVADELKEILPDVVREDVSRDASTGAQYQGVIYQDLIAVQIFALMLIKYSSVPNNFLNLNSHQCLYVVLLRSSPLSKSRRAKRLPISSSALSSLRMMLLNYDLFEHKTLIA